MTMPIVREHNLETNEIVERPMTQEEYDVYQTLSGVEMTKEEWELAEQQKANEKQTLLQKLGITEEEAKLLLS